MFFSIDPQSDVAIYEQIRRLRSNSLSADALRRAGRLLPDVRHTVARHRVKPSTIARRVFRELQTQGDTLNRCVAAG